MQSAFGAPAVARARFRRACGRVYWALMVCALTPDVAVRAQAPAATPTEETVAVDPIRCWWRADKGAIHIGETFRLTLTCAVLENDAVQVVPDESRLGSAVLTLAPFEVIGGAHPADLRSGSRRFFQYAYDVRILNRDVIGTDVTLPLLQINYRVNSRISGNAALEGRELSYLLPPQQVKVLSMVPQDAADIRDTPNRSETSFAEVESLAFRANLFRIVGMILIAIGALMAAAALIRLLLRARVRVPAHERTLSAPAVLRVASRELGAAVRAGESSGWTEAAIDRALAATRIAAAVALGRRVSQRVAASGSPVTEETAAEGRLVVRRRGQPVVLSSSATRGDLARATAALPAGSPQRDLLDELHRALTTFTAALYGREQAPDRTALDAAAASAGAAMRRLAAQQRAPLQVYRRWTAQPVQPEARG